MTRRERVCLSGRRVCVDYFQVHEAHMDLTIPVLLVVRFCGSVHTFVDPVDGDEEGLSRRLVVQVAESEAEAVATSEISANASAVFVPQTVHLHVVLREVLTR